MRLKCWNISGNFYMNNWCCSLYLLRQSLFMCTLLSHMVSNLASTMAWLVQKFAKLCFYCQILFLCHFFCKTILNGLHKCMLLAYGTTVGCLHLCSRIQNISISYLSLCCVCVLDCDVFLHSMLTSSLHPLDVPQLRHSWQHNKVNKWWWHRTNLTLWWALMEATLGTDTGQHHHSNIV